MLRIGTAGWAIKREYKDAFSCEGSQLTRYAGGLNAVEINSSFYRPHKTATYARWAQETRRGFSFAVKMPRAITHEARLHDAEPMLAKFFAECGGLGAKLGCVLVQLPPRLAFDPSIAAGFFGAIRKIYRGGLALEPRHASWFTQCAEDAIIRHGIARVAADPVPAKLQDKDKQIAAVPGGSSNLVYWRLHGSPQIYYSGYDAGFLDELSRRLVADAQEKDVWCIFDNTALGYATANALTLGEHLQTKCPAILGSRGSSCL
ncbi:MAG TPA: DUF72 domain-containing protein [Rhizomicrobium sp.]